MKLIRYGEPSEEKPGLVDKTGIIRDLSSLVADIGLTTLLPEALDRLRDVKPEQLPSVSSGVRIGPCVGQIGKFVCIGLNYHQHAVEAGAAVPAEPIVFMKATSAVSGPDDPIVIPKGARKVDWEVELGIIIGRGGKYIPTEDALSHIAGYCVINDISERAIQLEGTGQWVKGKSADSFGPIGPWLVTPDEIEDPQNLDLWLKVNDRLYQRGNTRDMIFDIPHLVSYLSQLMSLHPGDIISTGTPVGVGMGQQPPKYLQPGDRVTLGIPGLGEQRQTVVAYSAG